MSSPLTRFRVVAVLVGIGLLVHVLVVMPVRCLAGNPHFSKYFSPVPGPVYMLYLVATVDLGRRAGWTVLRMLRVMLAGTVPFLSFVVERRVAREAAAALRGAPA